MNQDHNKPLKEASWDANKMMGMAAIFISVLSMIAVAYQSYLAREENELIRIQQSASVLPYLAKFYSNNDGKYRSVVANKGVGPAFIKKVAFIANDLENKDTLFFKSSHQLFNFVEQQSPLIASLYEVKSSFHANMLLSPNEEKDLVVYSFKDRTLSDSIRREISKFFIGYNFIYEDVYGNAWELNSNKGYPQKLVKGK